MQTLTGRDLLKHLGQIRADTPGFLLECTRRFGDLVAFSVGSVQVYLVNHPDAVRHILQDNHRNYSKDTIQYNTLASITGRGLLTSDGETWLRNRRMEQPAFSRARLAALDEVIAPAAQAMLERWAQLRDQAEIDIDSEMMQVTLEVVGKALFSIDLRTDAPRLTRAVLTALDHVIYRAQNPFAPPDWAPLPRNLRFRRALAELDAAVYDILSARQAERVEGDDLLGMLLRARSEDGQPLKKVEIRDEIITLLIAGHETVASALTWTWYLLAQHPDAWERMRAEVMRLPQERLPAYRDLDQLTWCDQVFSEALRLYPPAWLITRKSLGEDVLLGERIPAGATMVISPYVIHRHPDFWAAPEEFQPQRFQAVVEKTWPRYAYIPFGGGPRLCIGNHFAQIEGVLLLAAVTQRYRLELAAGQKVKVDPLVTLRPHDGLHMRLHKL